MWRLKSESDLERVYAQIVKGKETGRFRYVFLDGSPAVEVGKNGLHGRTRSARAPKRARMLVTAGTVVAAGIVGAASRLIH